jgi:hypothetical protein
MVLAGSAISAVMALILTIGVKEQSRRRRKDRDHRRIKNT